jgi:ABC-type transport system involved in multi-copper enzyme maturation permease subunit
VSALLRSEWLKLRTTRTPLWMTLAMLVLVGIGTATFVGGTPDADLADQDWAESLSSAAGVVTWFALLLGILLMSGEYRHETITPTFLVSPRRGRVLTAKVVVAALAGVLLAVLAALVAVVVGLPWLSSRDVSVPGGELATNGVALLVSAAFWGALGVGVGALLRNQVLAVVLALVWVFIGETLVGALLGLAGAEAVAGYLPQAALGALIGADVGDDAPHRLVAGAVALAYVAGTAALAYAVTTRRDIT